ncbi:conserved hypothetical protein [Caldicellulosiruptor hydrothermalis 108]|uniref:Uncharacterized protein n=1 Tax=Caldicellulosiruptor hydrothermalis (strain DSM 18901 / VKM B-2411 / 108) TaxID=632292 RepID=E4Q9D4_CALH1|nr:hypothetical protein [Caldicellulosiruptor hydrothermalis]ADQ05805.1 conserved hypothetical protein [Caldicellulosiruptor hydrothermalis 108]
MKVSLIFVLGLLFGIGLIIIYNKLLFLFRKKKPLIKISPEKKSFDELVQVYNSVSQDIKRNLDEYSSFPTTDCGKILAASLFTQVTVCLSILSSLEKFGIDTKAVFDEIISKNKAQQPTQQKNF